MKFTSPASADRVVDSGTERSMSRDDRTQSTPMELLQLQATLNAIPTHTWYASPSGRLTFVNKRTADYLGLPIDHPWRVGIDNSTPWDAQISFLHPDDQVQTRDLWSTCLLTGEGGKKSFRVRSGRGGYRWFLGRVEPLRASDGTLVRWVGVSQDLARTRILKSHRLLRRLPCADLPRKRVLLGRSGSLRV
jgi:PAS domain-containing protein